MMPIPASSAIQIAISLFGHQTIGELTRYFLIFYIAGKAGFKSNHIECEKINVHSLAAGYKIIIGDTP